MRPETIRRHAAYAATLVVLMAYSLGDNVARTRFLAAPFDLAADGVLGLLATAERASPLRYVVTPNVDHVVRLARDATLRQAYDAAWLSICDSKPITLLARLLGVELSYLPGSDLTGLMFRNLIARGSRVALIAPSDEIAAAVAAAYPDLEIVSFAPPRGAAGDPAVMRACVEFVTTSRADFIFIAIGSPTSERIAHAASQDPRSEGVALCVGAGLEFLVGARRRAPRWMRAAGLEWLFRLCAEPRRLWRRYVLGVAPLISLFVWELRARRAARLQATGLKP